MPANSLLNLCLTPAMSSSPTRSPTPETEHVIVPIAPDSLFERPNDLLGLNLPFNLPGIMRIAEAQTRAPLNTLSPLIDGQNPMEAASLIIRIMTALTTLGGLWDVEWIGRLVLFMETQLVRNG